MPGQAQQIAFARQRLGRDALIDQITVEAGGEAGARACWKK